MSENVKEMAEIQTQTPATPVFAQKNGVLPMYAIRFQGSGYI